MCGVVWVGKEGRRDVCVLAEVKGKEKVNGVDIVKVLLKGEPD